MPPQPAAADSLTAWLKDQLNPDIFDNDLIGSWQDQSGFLRDWTQGNTVLQPRFKLNQRWGRPALDFDGIDNVLLGPSMSSLIALGAGTIMVAFYAANVTSNQVIITDSTGANGRIQLRITSAGKLQAFNASSAGNQVATTTDSVTVGWHIGIWRHNLGILYVYLDDPLRFNSALSGNTLAMTAGRIGARSNNTEYFTGQIGEVVISNLGWTEQNVSFVFAYLANRWLDRGDPLAQMRDVASRKLVTFERPRLMFSQDVPLVFLDQELLDPVALSHPHLPHPSGAGAGIERWTRRVVSFEERIEDLDANVLKVRMIDRSGLSHTYRESGVAVYSDDVRREGVAISGLGVARVHERVTGAWVEGEGGVLFVPAGTEAAELGGVFNDPAASQLLLRTSYVSQLTGLTLNGTGVNGSSIVAVAANTQDVRLFKSTVSAYFARFTAGSPHTADLYLSWPVSGTIAANEKLCLSLDAWINSDIWGQVLSWALQNSVDSKWWDDTSKTWSVSLVWNAITAEHISRTRSNVIVWPGTSGTAALRLGIPSGGVASRSGDSFHNQLEVGGFPTGRMIQNAGFVSPTRAATILGFFENTNAKLFNEPRGTLGCFLTVPWNAADLEAGSTSTPGGFLVTLWAVRYTPAITHSWRGIFNASRGAGLSRWEFAVKATGAEDVAFNNTQPVRGSTYAVVWRWSSATEGELGLPANTPDVFVDGVKGTSATITTRPTTIANSRIQLNLFGARMKRLFSTARVLTDEEILAWSLS